MSLINREALYEKACGLEAQALSYVGKIVNDESKIEEWKIWSAILTERTAFKHDIFDAPEVKPQRKKGRWIDETFKPWGLVHHPYKCDQCGEHSEADSDFCPNCGADMREPEDIPMEYFESGGR